RGARAAPGARAAVRGGGGGAEGGLDGGRPADRVDGAVDHVPGQQGAAAAVLPAGWHAGDEYQNWPVLTSRSGAFQIRFTIDTDRGGVYVYSGMMQLRRRHAPHERDQHCGVERAALGAEHAPADGARVEPDAVTDRDEGVGPHLLITREPAPHLGTDR